MKIHNLRTRLAAITALLAIGQYAYAAEPGSPIPIGASNDQQPGSVLVYNYYTSSITGGDNTRFTITNTNRISSVALHIFAVADSGTVADTVVCVTPNQTARFEAIDVDPGVSGYLIIIATDQNTGVPISFNYLIGSEEVRLASGHEAKLNAESFQALFHGSLGKYDPENPILSVDFDGVKYTKAPFKLAVDNISSLADGINTLVVLNSLNGNLATGVPPIGNVFGVAADNAENLFNFSFAAGAQFKSTLSSTFPKTTPSYPQIILQGQSGWMWMQSTSDKAMTGAVLNFKGANAAGYSGGANLHHLRNTSRAASLLVPVFPPSC